MAALFAVPMGSGFRGNAGGGVTGMVAFRVPDSGFRRNEGGGVRNDGGSLEWREGAFRFFAALRMTANMWVGRYGVWMHSGFKIPACAGMTNRVSGNDGWQGVRRKGLE